MICPCASKIEYHTLKANIGTRPPSVKITTSCIFDDIETFSSCSASQLCSEAVSGIYSQKNSGCKFWTSRKGKKQSNLQRLQKDSHINSRIKQRQKFKALKQFLQQSTTMESFATDRNKQHPVSTMQKTDWNNYSFLLVWSGLEKGFTNGCD